MCSNGRSTEDITDIESLLLDKKDDINIVNDNIEIYKDFTTELYEYYKLNYAKTKESVFRKKFTKKLNHINKGVKGISREKNKKGNYKKIGMTVKKTYLVYVYQKMIANKEIEMDEGFFRCIQKRPARNLSGVNSFAILLPPYPMEDDDEYEGFNGCRHNCYYCPDQTKKNGADVNIARSYLLKEPAVQRGFRCGWDAYTQMTDRMNSLARQGHKVDKLELIIEGGTYTEYPMEFLREFHRDIFYAANVFFNSQRERLTLREEISQNMLGQVRIIGICIETRPDAITDEWIRFFRESGTTRIQLGVQHTNNRILKKINRGHTFEESCSAVSRLRNNCFKIDIHLMPDLPLASPEKDKNMFDTIFLTNKLNPDQIKIYPCEVTPYTVIEKWHKSGRYTPYADKDPHLLLDVVKYALEICPPWIRVSRIIRDIPLEYIKGGNKYPNLRQMITDEMEKEGKYTNEIRSREIGRNIDYKYENAKYTTRSYETSDGGTEYFVSLESKDKRVIFGFIRLRIPPKIHNPVFPCLKHKGMIRELHVYNTLMSVGEKASKNSNSTQHRGTGKSLLKIAEWIAWRSGTDGTVVITGEGVRSYYHKRGYVDEDTFVVKNWSITRDEILYGILFILSIVVVHFIYKLFS
jgi:ELP3 family radical SAM enzyme/protein acetyltransferase